MILILISRGVFTLHSGLFNFRSLQVSFQKACAFSIRKFQSHLTLLKKFSVKDWSFPLRIFSKNATNSAFPADLVTFTEEFHKEKLHFLYSVNILQLTLMQNWNSLKILFRKKKLNENNWVIIIFDASYRPTYNIAKLYYIMSL